MKRLFLVALVTVFPLLAQDRSIPKVFVTNYDNVLPHVADGLGWTTRITLVNMGAGTATGTLYFYQDNGAPWVIGLKGRTGTAANWEITVPEGGSIFLETSAPGNKTSTGWAYLLTTSNIWGLASFREDYTDPSSGKAVYAEGVVPFAPENDIDFFIPFDNRSDYVTSIALVNSYLGESVTLTLEFRDESGTIILSDIIPLAPLQHMAFETTLKYPATRGKNGVIEFYKTAGNAGASALGLLFSPRNTVTSIHSVSLDCHYWKPTPCEN